MPRWRRCSAHRCSWTWWPRSPPTTWSRGCWSRCGSGTEMDRESTDTILVRCRVGEATGLHQAAERFCGRSGLALRPQRVAWAGDGGWTYVYAELPAPVTVVERALVPQLVRLWNELCPQATGTDVARL